MRREEERKRKKVGYEGDGRGCKGCRGRRKRKGRSDKKQKGEGDMKKEIIEKDTQKRREKTRQ